MVPEQLGNIVRRVPRWWAGRRGGARRVGALARTLEANENLSAQMLARHQLNLVRNLLSVAEKKVPYWRTLFAANNFDASRFRDLRDLVELPLLSKDALRTNLSEMVSDDIDPLRAKWDATGGSTGEPTRFVRSSLTSSYTYANEQRVWRWYGVPQGARQALVWGADRDLGISSWSSRLLGLRRLNAFAIDALNSGEFLQELEHFRPRIVYGYTSALTTIAKYMRDCRHRIASPPIAIRATAEALSEEDRFRIEEAFEAPVYNFYGARDFGPVAAELRPQDGLRVFSDLVYLEIIRPDGTLVGPDEVGEIVITKLHEFSMPLIRFKTGDRASWFGPPPDESSGLPRISSPIGRCSDFVLTASGRKIHGEFFAHLFYEVDGVERFQILQTDSSRILIRIQGSLDFNGSDFVQVLDAIAQQFADPNLRIETRRVAAISPESSGKYKVVCRSDRVKGCPDEMGAASCEAE